MSQTPKDTEGKKMKKQIIPVTISKKSNNMDYHKKLALHKRKNVMRMLITLAIIAAAAAAVIVFIQRRTFHSYKVVSSSDQEDTAST